MNAETNEGVNTDEMSGPRATLTRMNKSRADRILAHPDAKSYNTPNGTVVHVLELKNGALDIVEIDEDGDGKRGGLILPNQKEVISKFRGQIEQWTEIS